MMVRGDVWSTWNIFIPVYTMNFRSYPVLLSHKANVFIPHIVGFAGKYWQKNIRPLNFIIDSSIESSLFGAYVCT